jgi:hypothetical protein
VRKDDMPLQLSTAARSNPTDMASAMKGVRGHGSVALLATIAESVSYLHTHMLVAQHGQPTCVAALTPLSADGMIVAASTTLLADPRSGRNGGVLP